MFPPEWPLLGVKTIIHLRKIIDNGMRSRMLHGRRI